MKYNKKNNKFLKKSFADANNDCAHIETAVLSIVTVILFAFLLLVSGCTNIPQAKNSPASTVQPIGEHVATQGIMKFNSNAELQEFLIAAQSSGYSNSDSYSGLMRGGMATKSALMMEANVAASIASQDASESAQISSDSTDYSKTNVQVEGVDEADFVKNDGESIFIISSGELTIVDASSMEVSAKISTPKGAYAREMLINKNKLVLFLESGRESFYFQKYDIVPRQTYVQETGIFIYDVSDRAKPVLLEEFTVSGSYLQSRMIGNKIYLVAVESAYSDIIRPPVIMAKSTIKPDIYYFDSPQENYQYNTVMSINIDTEEVIDAKTFLLGYANTLMVSEDNIYIAYQKQDRWCFRWYCGTNEYDKERFYDVVLPLLEGELKSDINSIIAQGLSDDDEWKTISERLTKFYTTINDDESLSDASESMLERIADALDDYDTKKALDERKTVIHRIAINDGQIEYAAKGEVDGYLLNQFSMDEYDTELRVATTVDMWLESGRKSYNNVYILNSDMKVTGTLEGIAKDEQIYSSRFMGEKLYLVTFRQIDPFFVIDLSGKDPVVLGKLKIPGYSSYLHPYDENHIIAVGKNTGENEWGGVSTKGVKISMFDVSDVENPKEIDSVEIGMQGSDSPILYDHKAFLFSKEKGIVVLPLTEITSREKTGAYSYNNKIWDGAYVFSVSKNGFEEKGKVMHSSRQRYYFGWYDAASVSRSLYIGDSLYTISSKYIKKNDLSDNLKTLGSLTLLDVVSTPEPIYSPMKTVSASDAESDLEEEVSAGGMPADIAIGEVTTI
jgi:uncharacterized secreted protein with C-terminal beta-propeller domain